MAEFQKSLDNYNSLRFKANYVRFLQIEWQQNCWFSLQMKNTGQKVIENCKVELKFEREFEEPKYHTVIYKHYVDTLEEEKDGQVITLVKRAGSYGMMPGRGPSYMDKESDYNFE